MPLGGWRRRLGLRAELDFEAHHDDLAPLRFAAEREAELGFVAQAASLLVLYCQLLTFGFGPLSTPPVYEPVACVASQSRPREGRCGCRCCP